MLALNMTQSIVVCVGLYECLCNPTVVLLINSFSSYFYLIYLIDQERPPINPNECFAVIVSVKIDSFIIIIHSQRHCLSGGEDTAHTGI